MHKLTLSFKDRLLKVYTPETPEVSIGSGPDTDIQIDNLSVEPLHANVQFKDHKAFLQNPDRHKVLINNKTPLKNKDVELSRGDKLLIGKHTLTYLYDNELLSQHPDKIDIEPPPEPLSYNGWLQIMSGPKIGRTMHLDHNNVRIKSAGKAGALISNHKDGYYISHLDKTLTVSVNGKDIGDQQVHLQEGQAFKVGDLQMMFFTQD